MPIKRVKKSTNATAIIITSVIVVTAAVVGYLLWKKGDQEPAPQTAPEKIRVAVKTPPVIDYSKLEKDQELKMLMKKRKAEYGIDKGVDMIVQSDESIKIGESTVPMQTVLDKIRLTSGEIIEKDIAPTGKNTGGKIQVFGIHVVLAGDSIWNIHFRLLKEYFGHKGISLSPAADEPDNRGYSSGVGKLLKFSENIVHIYNIKEERLDVDINLLQPFSKIVVYNMNQIFMLLDQIDYTHVNRIQFDGNTIWIPSAS